MQEQTKSDIEEIILSNINAIKDPYTEQLFKNNPRILLEYEKVYMSEVEILSKLLKNQLDELTPFIKNLKNNISDITEKTTLCAIYLLLCSVIQCWNSIFILSKYGEYHSIATLLRKIDEAITQIELFIHDYNEKNNLYIEKWFKGETIKHGIGRKKLIQKTNEIKSNYKFDFDEKIFSQLYSMTSQVPHNAYTSMLEMVNPFTKDYDFNLSTGYYATIGALNSAINYMTDFTIIIEMTYISMLKDIVNADKIDLIKIKYNPKMNIQNTKN